MHIAICATENQKQEILQKGFSNKVNVQWTENFQQLSKAKADVYFDLLFNDADLSSNKFIDGKPVFFHAVNCVCREINKPNYIRLNAWNDFLNRSITELVCCPNDLKKIAEKVFNELEWNFVFVADDYGFVAARIIAMIINEAYYALEENVSTKEQIDIAMKLGTNYPYGPFEWSVKIGLQNILMLLQKLSTQNKRYTISALLVHESQQF
ncbi:MAG TPA: 3-hydroxyacyl-CoA dehydrogenase family protein [Parafilimonas sp.]